MANILPSTRAQHFRRAIYRLMADERWTIKDLADWLHVSRPTVYRYLEDVGNIPGCKIFELMSRMESNDISWN